MLKLARYSLLVLMCSCGAVQLTERSDFRSTGSAPTDETIENCVPKGWGIQDSVLRFVPENLYEHINGRAEFYLAYNFVSLTFANVKKVGEDEFIHVSVYDMGMPTNAFGVFSAERWEEGTPLPTGRDAYQSGPNCYVWKGQYYIQIIALGESEGLGKTAAAIARGLSRSLPDSGSPVPGLELLPHKERVPHREKYFLADAFGLDFLTDTYTAEYKRADTEITAFVSRRKTSSDAESIIKQYAEYAGRYGKDVERVTVGDIVLTVCDMGDRFDLVSQKGNLVCGVVDVTDRNLAIRAATELWRQLEEN